MHTSLAKRTVGSLGLFLGNKTTRVIAGATIAVAVVLVATELFFADSNAYGAGGDCSQRPSPMSCWLLLTRSLQKKLSLYGYS